MEGNGLFKSMNPMVAYEKGLTTWARWVDLNLDPRKTKVIFRSMSPRHNRYLMKFLMQIIHFTFFFFSFFILLGKIVHWMEYDT